MLVIKFILFFILLIFRPTNWYIGFALIYFNPLINLLFAKCLENQFGVGSDNIFLHIIGTILSLVYVIYGLAVKNTIELYETHKDHPKIKNVSENVLNVYHKIQNADQAIDNYFIEKAKNASKQMSKKMIRQIKSNPEILQSVLDKMGKGEINAKLITNLIPENFDSMTDMPVIQPTVSEQIGNNEQTNLTNPARNSRPMLKPFEMMQMMQMIQMMNQMDPIVANSGKNKGMPLPLPLQKPINNSQQTQQIQNSSTNNSTISIDSNELVTLLVSVNKFIENVSPKLPETETQKQKQDLKTNISTFLKKNNVSIPTNGINNNQKTKKKKDKKKKEHRSILKEIANSNRSKSSSGSSSDSDCDHEDKDKAANINSKKNN
jgi:hypothetical protein